MNNFSVLDLLARYEKSGHITPDEHESIARFKQLLASRPDCFGRQPGGHITSSAWIINPAGNAALLTHHKKLNKWFQLGGHCDDNPDAVAGALREAQEESGIQHFNIISPGIFDIDIHALPNVCAWHYDVRILLQATSDEIVVSDESHDLAWVPFDQMERYSSEDSVLRMNKKYKENLW